MVDGLNTHTPRADRRKINGFPIFVFLLNYLASHGSRNSKCLWNVKAVDGLIIGIASELLPTYFSVRGRRNLTFEGSLTTRKLEAEINHLVCMTGVDLE